jgi:hypothetical protein
MTDHHHQPAAKSILDIAVGALGVWSHFDVTCNLSQATFRLPPIQSSTSALLAYQRRVRDHRWRGGGPGGRWHDRLFRSAKRAEGPLHQDRDGRLRSALSQRLRPPQTALFERRAYLKKLIADTDVQFSESFEIDGPAMFKHACGIGLEGVVSKVRDSKYPAGRSNDWVKKTCAQRETLTIAGFALDGSKWDGLYLGRRKGPAGHRRYPVYRKEMMFAVFNASFLGSLLQRQPARSCSKPAKTSTAIHVFVKKRRFASPSGFAAPSVMVNFVSDCAAVVHAAANR